MVEASGAIALTARTFWIPVVASLRPPRFPFRRPEPWPRKTSGLLFALTFPPGDRVPRNLIRSIPLRLSMLRTHILSIFSMSKIRPSSIWTAGNGSSLRPSLKSLTPKRNVPSNVSSCRVRSARKLVFWCVHLGRGGNKVDRR